MGNLAWTKSWKKVDGRRLKIVYVGIFIFWHNYE